MTYSSAEARQQLLDGIGDAIDELTLALAGLGEAYEQLDDYSAETLEEDLFGPVQKALGRAKRAYSKLAADHGLSTREFEPRSAGVPSIGPKGFIENAVVAALSGDHVLAELQDTQVLVEVGDPELRSSIAQIRELLGNVEPRARALTRKLGR